MLKIKRYAVPLFLTLVLTLLSLLFAFPIFFTLVSSFMEPAEINELYGSGGRCINFRLIPRFVSAIQYKLILLNTDQYLLLFWRSVRNLVFIVAGQVLFSAMAGFALTIGNFPLKNAIKFLYITVALLPFQVTLVPNYLTLSRLGLLNTHLALILPAIASPFGVFLLSQQMKYIPLSLMEAARIDGASLFQVFAQVFLPLSKPSIMGLVVLCFIENWNMIEQPLIFINDSSKYPLSLYLYIIANQDIIFICAASVVFMLLPFLIFVYAGEHLITGIELSAMK
jgi:multiple sugar transport system permease protein